MSDRNSDWMSIRWQDKTDHLFWVYTVSWSLSDEGLFSQEMLKSAFLQKNWIVLNTSIPLHAGLIQLSSVWGQPGPRQGLTDLSRCECDWRHFPQECLKTRSTTTMWSNLQNFSTVLAAPTCTWCQARLVCTIVRFFRWQECGNLVSYINAVNILKW